MAAAVEDGVGPRSIEGYAKAGLVGTGVGRDERDWADGEGEADTVAGKDDDPEAAWRT